MRPMALPTPAASSPTPAPSSGKMRATVALGADFWNDSCAVAELEYEVEKAPSVFVVSAKLQVLPVAPPYRQDDGVVNVLSVHCWM